MNMPPGNTAFVRLAGSFSRAQRRLGNALSIHGIGFSEYLVLWHLSAAPANAMRRIDLAECLGLTASGITRLVNPMEKTGLVAKQALARDARVSLVVLTNAGARVLSEAAVAFESVTGEWLGRLSAGERRAVEKLADVLAG